ncbi:hypothetical protein BZA77DRAFT_60511 [Pyronema omphalodes]|nr:hypothetical protein BZA77DRAFT_60511 [Pyronema omphalodes]
MSRPQATQLTWHNTLPEDFTNYGRGHTAAAGSRKRQAATGLDASLAGGSTLQATAPGDAEKHISGDYSAGDASPTKRHRGLAKKSSLAGLKTESPVEPSLSASIPPLKCPSAENQEKGTEHGMQTPPSSSAGIKKRSRVPIQRSLSTGNTVLSPPHTSPSKLALAPQVSPAKRHQSSTSVLNTVHSLTPRQHATINSLSPRDAGPYTQKALYWDDGLSLPSLPRQDQQPGWSVIRQNMFTARAVSPDLTADSANFLFSFDSDYSEQHYSNYAPGSVNPNLLFSEPSSTASSMIDGVHDSHSTSRGPYHHQNLQSQREQEERRARRAARKDKGDSFRRKRRHEHPRASIIEGEVENDENEENIPLYPVRYFNKSRTSPTKSMSSTRSHTEVVLTIAADGRAIAKTTVIHEPADPPSPLAPADVDEPLVEEPTPDWESGEESDSSFDEGSPRGLAPDGGEYLSFRRRKQGMREGRISMRGSKSRSSISIEPLRKDHTVPVAPHTPPAPNVLLPATGLFALPPAPMHPHPGPSTLSATSGAIPRRALDSSPRLPAPFRSSPPQLKRPDTADAPTPATIRDEGSEAETVVDQDQEMEDDDTDAVSALRKVVRGRSGGSEAPSTASTISRPSLTPLDLAPRLAPGTLSSPTKSLKSTPQISPSISSFTSRRKRRQPADGGYHRPSSAVSRDISPTTITDPDYVSGTDCGFTEEEEAGYERDGEDGEADEDGDMGDMASYGHEEVDDEGITRCLCGRGEEDGQMVQCESCTFWLHIRCLGHSKKSLPQVFVCPFCTNYTPQQRRETRGARDTREVQRNSRELAGLTGVSAAVQERERCMRGVRSMSSLRGR